MCNTCCKLLNYRMAIGHERANLLRFRHSSSRPQIPKFAAFGALSPAVMRIFMQKQPALLALPSMDFHQRLQVTQSGFKGFLELRVSSSVHGLQVHDCLYTSAIQLRAQVVRLASTRTDVRRSPEHPAKSHKLRDMSKINPCVKPMRFDVASVLGWLKISATLMSNKPLPKLQQVVGYSASCCPSRPATSRNCS